MIGRRMMLAGAAAVVFGGSIAAHPLSSFELTQAQAIARVRSVIRAKASTCRITKTQSVTAVRVAAGWRVTARILMSASGISRSERAVWIVSQARGAVAQDQLTAEIATGCP